MLATIASCVLTLSPGTASVPRLSFDDRAIQSTLGEAYAHAIDNLLRINVLKLGPGQQRSGLIADSSGSFVRAGGDYQDPWTRDASVNSWNAASLLAPDIARNTLWAVCDKTPDGQVIVQRDNQWWDKVIWVVAAWNHYATTGDRKFLEQAYRTSVELVTDLKATRFDREFGLFQGPSHIQDGIAGYPAPFDDPAGSSSFILDHPGSEKLMTLGVNCLYVQAFRCLALMAAELKTDSEKAKEWKRDADDLRKAIDARFWMPKKGSYAYLLYGEGELRGKQAEYQEASGISFVVLFSVADARRAKQVVKNAKITPHGIALVEPEFARYEKEGPGRHSRIVWPLAQGYWATAAAKAGDVEAFRRETQNLADLAKSTRWNFYEIYNPTTGQPDGGMQNGHRWGSCSNQTWSATAYIRMIHYGLFGMSFAPSGLSFAPSLPQAWGSVTLKGIRYRKSTLDIRLTGSGRKVAEFKLDGEVKDRPFVASNLVGKHEIEIRMK